MTACYDRKQNKDAPVRLWNVLTQRQEYHGRRLSSLESQILPSTVDVLCLELAFCLIVCVSLVTIKQIQAVVS